MDIGKIQQDAFDDGYNRGVKETKKECDYWKNEALKWANELGEGRIGPLLYMDEERGKQ